MTTIPYLEPDEIIMTFDVDWAPDEVCRYCVEKLEEFNARATFFATHQSDYLQELIGHDQIEIGIHPNYSVNEPREDTLAQLLEWYPEADCVRAHGLQVSTELLQLYERNEISVNADQFLPGHCDLQPAWRFGEGSILTVPYFWEDDNYFSHYGDVQFAPDEFLNCNGLRVFNFHPIHIYANTQSLDHYKQIKEDYKNPERIWSQRADVGTENFFLKLLESDNRIETIGSLLNNVSK